MAFQNHIHLFPITAAPAWQWHITKYQPTPESYGTTNITQTGNLVQYALRNAGVPVITHTIELIVIVRAEYGRTAVERGQDLESMLERVVNFVPNEHVESPLGILYTCLVQEIGAYDYYSPALDKAHVPVKLKRGIFLP